ncbi:hypothetical protein [Chitinophaga barathri]|uniref:Uncharacterized protein n=1 Tax=Chitinophaga barathri TaxID=1647451 RepID=A0A3N4MDG9_9BACT|nr:hypothetical protein [Chitinophaga barathri]RPD41982.1 hypothetical protein EG028_07435 [Chitinophaga barathri]
MTENKEIVPVSGMVLVLLVTLNAVVLRAGLTRHSGWYWALCLTIPLLLIVTKNARKKQPGTAKANLSGQLRWLLRVW